MANLSRDYTVADVWREAIRDIPQATSFPHFMQLPLVNRAQALISGLFYDLMSAFYMDDATIVPAATGAYSTSTGTYTASTKTLTIAMSSNFISSMIGNLIVFRVGSSVYVATILSITSTTSVVVGGYGLPASNQASVTEAIMAPTSVSSDIVSLSSMRVMMTGQQARLSIESSITNYISPVSMDELRVWRTSAAQNAAKIVYAISGQNVYLKHGSSLASCGTLTFHYPRVAKVMTASTDYIDLPDGVAIHLLIIMVRSLVAQRIGVQMPDVSQEISQKVQMMYQTFGAESTSEEIKKKVEALR